MTKSARPIFLIAELFEELFDPGELRHFLLRQVGSDILAHLPTATTPVEFFDIVALALNRRGELDERFFEALIEVRPKRQDVIRDTALEYFGVIGEQRELVFRGVLDEFGVERLRDIVEAAKSEIGAAKALVIRITPGSVRVGLLVRDARPRWLRLLRYKYPWIFRPEQLEYREVLMGLEDIRDVSRVSRRVWLDGWHLEWRRRHFGEVDAQPTHPCLNVRLGVAISRDHAPRLLCISPEVHVVEVGTKMLMIFPDPLEGEGCLYRLVIEPPLSSVRRMHLIEVLSEPSDLVRAQWELRGGVWKSPLFEMGQVSLIWTVELVFIDYSMFETSRRKRRRRRKWRLTLEMRHADRGGNV